MSGEQPKTTLAGEFPRTAFALAIGGGILILGFALLVLTTVASVGSVSSVASPIWGTLLGVGGVATGIAVLVVALLLRTRPRRYPLWGALLVVLAITSMIVAAGGLFVGFILALFAGIATLAWTPSWERAGGSTADPPGIG